jgi:signal transduction histidine kinase
MPARLLDRIAALSALGAIALATVSALIERPAAYGLLLLAAAVAMLVVGAWWLRRRAPGSPFRELAIPASVATVMPLLVVATSNYSIGHGIWLLAALAAGTLGVGLAEVTTDRYRLSAFVAAAGLAGLSAVLGGLARPPGSDWNAIAVLLLAGATAAPGVLAGVSRRQQPSTGGERVAVVEALELGVAGVTAAISVILVGGSGVSIGAVVALIAWILVVLAADYFAVEPLARSATVATTERDIVVAAMEAERSRIAADIHDDALQELTLLSWRLDQAGDTASAASAREVADRLRAILGDLRLPILDDLGTGSALEWLVERVEPLAGGEVRLERGDKTRPPADVELAFFRIAQEALSNAVRHGRPPIVVRYWTSPSAATLSIDDAGDGFDPSRLAPATADVDGHFGMVNMRQRAEQIGALLDFRRWPAGGTQVSLEWRAR